VPLPRIKIEAKQLTVISVTDLLPEKVKNLSSVAVFPNSGNHAYCRVVLDGKSLLHLFYHLMKPHISTYDRAYLWIILHDHVYMQNF